MCNLSCISVIPPPLYLRALRVRLGTQQADFRHAMSHMYCSCVNDIPKSCHSLHPKIPATSVRRHNLLTKTSRQEKCWTIFMPFYCNSLIAHLESFSLSDSAILSLQMTRAIAQYLLRNGREKARRLRHVFPFCRPAPRNATVSHGRKTFQ